jgi:phage-related protein
MSSVLRSLMIKVGADLTDFEKKMSGASKTLAGTGKSLTNAGKGLTTGVTVPILGAAAGLTGLAVKGAETADEILTLSAKTGIATDTLQEMQYASELVDVDLETMTGSMFKLTKNMDNARKGTKDQVEAFSALGIEITNADGSLRDSKEVWYEALDALGGMSNETERNALAQRIFGRSFAELNPLIDAGTDALQGFMDEAEGMGAVLSEEELANLGEFDDTIQRLKASFAGAGAKIGAAFLPVIQTLLPIIEENILPMLKDFTKWVGEMSQKFADLSPGTQKFILTLLGIAIAAGPALIAFGKVATGLSEMIKLVPKIVGGIQTVSKVFSAVGKVMMTNPILLIVAAIALAAILIITHWEEVSGFFIALWDKLKEIFQGAWDFISGLLNTAWEVINTIWGGIKDFITGIWEGIKKVGETIWNAITDFLMSTWEGYKKTFTAIWDAIKWFAETVWNGIKVIGETIWNGITTFFKTIWEGWKTTFTTIWDGIKGFAETVWSGIKGTASTIWGGISSFFTTVWGTMKETVFKKAGEMAKNAAEKFLEMKTAISNKMSEIGKAIADFFTSLPKKALEWGENMIKGFINGIKKMFGKLGDGLKSIGSKIKEFLGFGSPTKKGEGRFIVKWGENMVKGFMDGVNNALPDMQMQLNAVIPNLDSASSPSYGGNVTQNIQVTVKADNLQQMADVVALFNSFKQVSRQGV